MEEKKQHFQHIILYYFKKGKNPTETNKKKICAVYGEGAVTDWTCQKWFEKLSVRDFSLDNTPRSGRPVEVDSDQIETLIENSQHYNTQEIANILKISKSSIENHLHQLGYVNSFDVWVSHKLVKKTFLTIFPHAILYWNGMKMFRSLNKLWWAMKSGYCRTMWNGRDNGASKMNHHQPHQRLVFI